MNTEKARLSTVRGLDAYHFDKNKELNDLVKLAAYVCNVPIALLTFMDEDVQWIKSAIGTDVDRNSREHSFCRYLMDQNEILEVPDALLDNRFVHIPIVAGPPSIRFYAGAPLITTEGQHIGSLCVLDQQPHLLNKRQREMLAVLSRQAMHLMEVESGYTLKEQQRLALLHEKELTAASERKLRAFFNSSASCHILISPDLKVLDFNRMAESFVKTLRKKQIKQGANILNFVSPSFRKPFRAAVLRAFKGEKIDKEAQIVNPGRTHWWSMTFSPIGDDSGNITNIAFHATNITAHKAYEADILEKNDSLTRIAYVQSHDYRRPVASILGIMNVIKDDDYDSPKEFLELLDRAVSELDEQMRAVIAAANQFTIKKVG